MRFDKETSRQKSGRFYIFSLPNIVLSVIIQLLWKEEFIYLSAVKTR